MTCRKEDNKKIRTESLILGNTQILDIVSADYVMRSEEFDKLKPPVMDFSSSNTGKNDDAVKNLGISDD